jgi:hypothetical protein
LNDQVLTQAQLDGFREAAQSLKLYRRAEIADAAGAPLIEQLYVDPLPNNHVLATTLKHNTTFLIGRKGTGKSTVFQRAQHELRGSETAISAYVDIKTVYESSQVDPALIARVTSADTALPSQEVERLLLYRAFIHAVIDEIRKELKDRIRRTLWQKLKSSLNKSLDELFAGLDTVASDVAAETFISVLATREESMQVSDHTEEQAREATTASIALSPSPTASLGVNASATSRYASSQEKTYRDILMRVFNMRDYVRGLRDVLEQAGIQHLYVFIDDFSELPEPAMRLVVDTLLAPLNNWSDELVKFKVAAYPGRIYYGLIDKTKIDEINLDLYSLYGGSDIGAMEDKAIDFTRRLIERRFEYFCHTHADTYLDTRGEEDLWRHLFYATMANPRNLGYVLFFLYENNLVYRQRINLRALRDAAQRYYEEKIEAYFAMSRFLHESFSERSSIYSLKELLEALVQRARDLRRHRGSAVLRGLSGRPPTSHFHVVRELEGLLTTLELNFFLTKYYEQRDRDGREVTVFALNYGLCNKNAIEFGRPSGRREYRLYYVERIFDDTPILQKYLRTNQEIVCDNPKCARRYDHEDLAALALYEMLCPTCRSGTCAVTNLSRKYERMLRSIDDDLLLPRIELDMIQALGTERRPLFAQEIAGELDCSYQLIGKRGVTLADRGLVDRSENRQGRRQFEITPTAESIYFADPTAGEIGPADEDESADEDEPL